MEFSLTTHLIKELLSKKNVPPRKTTFAAEKRAAVLIPLIQQESKWKVLFTRRSDSVNDHKGQVSFPGGSIEQSDESPVAAAIREANEEIGLKPEHVAVLGELPPQESVTGYVIFPVVAKIEWPVPLTINPNEVSRVFTIPLDWLAKQENYEIRDWLSPIGLRQGVVFFRPYDGEQLWGISARIMLDLLEKLNLIPAEE